MQVKKTVKFTLHLTFSAEQQETEKMAGNESGVSQHQVLVERLRAEAARVLRNGGFAVDQD